MPAMSSRILQLSCVPYGDMPAWLWHACCNPACCAASSHWAQGSDNLDHWRVNLTFDPVPFEDPTLGVKVHAVLCMLCVLCCLCLALPACGVPMELGAVALVLALAQLPA